MMMMMRRSRSRSRTRSRTRRSRESQGGRVPWTTVIMTLKRVKRPRPDPDPAAQQVLSFVGAAQAPSKYMILESCPSLETEENMRELIGAQILHAWDDKARQGWFEGRVNGPNLNGRHLPRAPTTNFSL